MVALGKLINSHTFNVCFEKKKLFAYMPQDDLVFSETELCEE